MVDPRDQRSEAEIFDVVGGDDGVLGSIGLLACEDHCPKGLPLATQMAYLRRKWVLLGVGQRTIAGFSISIKAES